MKAIQEVKVPENVNELQSFLGLVTFYGSFIPNLSMVAHPLYELLKKDVNWEWSEECQHAFDSIKGELLSKRFLTHYQPHLPVKLTCDTSSVGIGAVLSHVMPDGIERPIAFASRSLNNAEKNYSQIEKEGLALVFGVKKFHIYLYGKQKFTLVTDHKPLLVILGSKAGLPTIVAARLQRWAITLAAYSYELEYNSTNKIGNADALSRLPVDGAPNGILHSILMVDNLSFPVNSKEIAQKTKLDPVLSKVLQALISGHSLSQSQEELKPYLQIWSELTIENGCIMRNARVVIPKILQTQVLNA